MHYDIRRRFSDLLRDLVTKNAPVQQDLYVQLGFIRRITTEQTIPSARSNLQPLHRHTSMGRLPSLRQSYLCALEKTNWNAAARRDVESAWKSERNRNEDLKVCHLHKALETISLSVCGFQRTGGSLDFTTKVFLHIHYWETNSTPTPETEALHNANLSDWELVARSLMSVLRYCSRTQQHNSALRRHQNISFSSAGWLDADRLLQPELEAEQRKPSCGFPWRLTAPFRTFFQPAALVRHSTGTGVSVRSRQKPSGYRFKDLQWHCTTAKAI